MEILGELKKYKKNVFDWKVDSYYPQELCRVGISNEDKKDLKNSFIGKVRTSILWINSAEEVEKYYESHCNDINEYEADALVLMHMMYKFSILQKDIMEVFSSNVL